MKTQYAALAGVIAGVLLSLAGCDDAKKAAKIDSNANSPAPSANVLAVVNGVAIHSDEVERTAQRSLGETQVALLDQAGRKKVLESIVLSRVMAQESSKELTAEEKRNLDNDVAAYKEQLLVKSYLSKHATAQPVTDEMVKTYYQEHTPRFGGTTVRRFDMLVGTQAFTDQQRETLLKAVPDITKASDWKAAAKKLQMQQIPIAFGVGSSDDKLLNPRLQALIAPLKKGDTSNITLVDGKPYLLRITEESQQTAKPLSEVSGEIRQALVPLQMKKAIKDAADTLMKSANVEYK